MYIIQDHTDTQSKLVLLIIIAILEQRPLCNIPGLVLHKEFAYIGVHQVN